ncbi:MAG: hypothetical protein LZF86_190377 [Nitrospira sp.]|nr:MAG: hypothetical protein LZF86_190377 [Nitrospira sp.]
MRGMCFGGRDLFFNIFLGFGYEWDQRTITDCRKVQKIVAFGNFPLKSIRFCLEKFKKISGREENVQVPSFRKRDASLINPLSL